MSTLGCCPGGCVSPGHLGTPAVSVPGTGPCWQEMARGLARWNGVWPTWKGHTEPFLQVSSSLWLQDDTPCIPGNPHPQANWARHKFPWDLGICRAGRITDKVSSNPPVLPAREACLHPAFKALAPGRAHQCRHGAASALPPSQSSQSCLESLPRRRAQLRARVPSEPRQRTEMPSGMERPR